MAVLFLGVLDKDPCDGLSLVWRHGVALGDRGGSAGRSLHLPDAALWTALSRVCRGADRSLGACSTRNHRYVPSTGEV